MAMGRWALAILSPADFNARVDLDGDGSIGFGDFLKFAQNFGKTVGG